MSLWGWFLIAIGLLLGFRVLAQQRPQHRESAQRMSITTVLTALGLGVAHAWHLRSNHTTLQHTQARSAIVTLNALQATDQRARQAARQAQIQTRIPVIRWRLLMAAYDGELGMYEGRMLFGMHCVECHAEDGDGVIDQPKSPSILGLGGRERDDLQPYLMTDHLLSYSGVLDEPTLERLESFLWAGLREPFTD